MSALDNIEIAIVAPCPRADVPHEGWMSRIRAIDRQFEGRKRVYMNISDRHGPEPSKIRWDTVNRGEVLLKSNCAKTDQFISEVVRSVRMVYVHTLHLAEYVVAHLLSGNVVVDIHGITPEEETMLGRAHLRQKYEEIERRVLREARYCICVSDAMRVHYRNKYPFIQPNWITIPIIEAYPDAPLSAHSRQRESEFPTVIYSGGAQAWQNIDAMLRLLERCGQWATFRFFSHEFEVLQRRAKALGLESSACFSYCHKMDLPAAYSAGDFGMVLRDDTPVNRVSCPTKLIEYIQFGLVPIVRSPALGDFLELGYAYVTEEEFVSGFFPDAASREWMVARNREVLWELSDRFQSGVAVLRAAL